MKLRYVACGLCIVSVTIAANWTLVRGDDKGGENAKETYTPTVDEWLQVYLNANFAQHDTQHVIGFVVMPGKKTVSMMAHIYQHPREKHDPGRKAKLEAAADAFEAQARAYIKRFGYELKRQSLP